MPILHANRLVFTIGDLATEVIIKCENRTSDVARAYNWLRDAILEVTGNTDLRDDFDELEAWSGLFELTPQIQEYDFYNNLIDSDDYNQATLDVLLWTDPPTNKQRIQLNPSHYQSADRGNTSSPSQPTEWYRFGDTIGFNPVPDKAYQTQARILRMHPINDNKLEMTNILLDRTWNEILVWEAVQRGFMELLEFEKASKIRDLLHGDPKHPDKPGLYSGRKKRRKKEAWRKQQALRPIIRGYGWGRRY